MLEEPLKLRPPTLFSSYGLGLETRFDKVGVAAEIERDGNLEGGRAGRLQAMVRRGAAYDLPPPNSVWEWTQAGRPLLRQRS